MKTISVMKVRRSLGEILDEVNLKSESFILERAGKPIAKLVPLDSVSEHQVNRRTMKAVKELKGLNPGTERGESPDAWLEDERGSW